MSAGCAPEAEAAWLEMQQPIVTAQRAETLVRPETPILQAAHESLGVDRDAMRVKIGQRARGHDVNQYVTRRKFDSTWAGLKPVDRVGPQEAPAAQLDPVPDFRHTALAAGREGHADGRPSHGTGVAKDPVAFRISRRRLVWLS